MARYMFDRNAPTHGIPSLTSGMTKAVLDALMSKQAGRGTVLRIVRALGGGARGRSALNNMRSQVAAWIAGGGRAPSELDKAIGRLHARTFLPYRRLYGVLDPSGRLGAAREIGAMSEASASSLSGRSSTDWLDNARSWSGLYGSHVPILLAERPGAAVRRWARAQGWDRPVPASRMTAEGRDWYLRSNPLGRMRSRWADNVSPSQSEWRPTKAQVEVRPGETAVQAVRRDMLSRLWPGTRLAGPRGVDTVRNARLALNMNGDIGYTDNGVPARDNNVLSAMSRKINSSSSVLGVQGAASRSGNTVTYLPYVNMHEFSHALYDHGHYRPGTGAYSERFFRSNPSLIRKIMAAGPEDEAKMLAQVPSRIRGNRSTRAWATRYAGGSPSMNSAMPLPPVTGQVRDPVQLFRQLSPTVYSEVAANTGAFGDNSRLWPAEIRRAFGTYLGDAFQDPQVFARMPGSTPAQKMMALREYVNMAKRFTSAPEIPYSTAWNGTSRGVASW